MAYPTSVATDADLYLVKNQLATQLDGSIDASQTTITVDSTTGFPTVGVVTIDSEVIKYTGLNATQFTGCTRGFDGTGATTHTDNAPVRHAVTAIHHNAVKDELIALENALLNGPTGQLKVLQYVYATSTGVTNNTDSANYTNTGLTASITPQSTSNKILVIASGNITHTTLGENVHTTIMRNGSTNIGGGVNNGLSIGLNPASATCRWPCTMMVLDSPASVASTSYTVAVKRGGGAGTASWNEGAHLTTILLVELVG